MRFDGRTLATTAWYNVLAVQRSYDAQSVGQYTLVYTAEYKPELCFHTVFVVVDGSGGLGPSRIDVYEESNIHVRFRTYDTNGNLYNPQFITYRMEYLAAVGQKPATL